MAVNIEMEKCLGCGCCSDICRFGALELQEKAVVNDEFCTECGECCEVCPATVLKI